MTADEAGQAVPAVMPRRSAVRRQVAPEATQVPAVTAATAEATAGRPVERAASAELAAE